MEQFITMQIRISSVENAVLFSTLSQFSNAKLRARMFKQFATHGLLPGTIQEHKNFAEKITALPQSLNITPSHNFELLKVPSVAFNLSQFDHD